MGRDGSSTWVMQGAVVVSILAHASFLAAAGLRPPRPAPEELAPPADTWAGTTSAPIGGELHEVDVTGSETLGGSGEPVAPAPETPNEPSEPPAAKTPADPPKPAPAKPISTARTPPPKPKTPAPDPTSPADTSKPDFQNETTSSKPSAPRAQVKSSTDVVSNTTAPTKPATPSAKVPDGEEKIASGTPGDTTGKPNTEPGSGGGSFGSAGASSVRDLGRAFTRALPMAGGSDAAWGKLPVGKGGSIEVALIVSEEGKITGVEPLAPSPPAHLLKAIKNTTLLLRGGTFALQGSSVTAGKQILKLTVELSDTEAPEDTSGAGAFGLAHRWEGKRGVASFTQTSGRHVEITVEFLRVEITRG
ncbi:hypothetical protein [Polyangium spumosum]|uniref:Uncharacterized protein n=1 Tax=Polyangium spumosum TaxID=889282 RepID=A0A6N7Q569_9BACT|nr:hypothetical protein [Polyangium spumosum]MRG95991.1 hypothetical protein [Polyangium spumosum]